MPAPLNNRFSIQSRQNFKIEFCGVAWDRAVFFVDKALETMAPDSLDAKHDESRARQAGRLAPAGIRTS